MTAGAPSTIPWPGRSRSCGTGPSAWSRKRDDIRTIELLERLLLLAPQHASALAWLASLLREQGMVEEMLGITERLLALQTG